MLSGLTSQEEVIKNKEIKFFFELLRLIDLDKQECLPS